MIVTTLKWTIEDYHEMIQAGLLKNKSVELLLGDIIIMSPEIPLHVQLNTDTADYLRRLLGDKVLIRNAKPITIFESNSEPEPDLAIVQPLSSVYKNHHPYPEQVFWVIEYAYSSLAKDLEIKRKLYTSANIKEYWLIDLKNSQIKVFR